MIFSIYRELVTPKDAETWFAITPKSREKLKAERRNQKSEKIVAMPDQAAA